MEANLSFEWEAEARGTGVYRVRCVDQDNEPNPSWSTTEEPSAALNAIVTLGENLNLHPESVRIIDNEGQQGEQKSNNKKKKHNRDYTHVLCLYCCTANSLLVSDCPLTTYVFAPTDACTADAIEDKKHTYTQKDERVDELDFG